MLTGEITALGVTRLLDAIRIVDPEIRFYQASSSEMFGKVQEVPADASRRRSTRAPPTASPRSTATGSRSTTASPTTCTPVSGILFNHESPRRGLEFVRAEDHPRGGPDQARAGRRAAARQPRRRARLGLRRRLRRGDVAHAPAGRARRLRRRHRTRRTRSASSARSPSGTSASAGRTTSCIDERFMRPAEVDLLVGDATQGAGGARLGAADVASRSS